MREISNSDFDFLCTNLEAVARSYSRQSRDNRDCNIARRMVQMAKRFNRKNKTKTL